MGRHSGGSGYGHHARKITPDTWEISWMYDRYYTGCRLRYPQTMSRITNKAGAERFAKKWCLNLRDDGKCYQ